MKRTAKGLLVSAAAVLLSIGAAGTMYAASDKTKVGKISLVFDSDLGIGTDGRNLDVTCEGGNTDRYHIDDVEIVNTETEYSDSNPPEVEITLVVELSLIHI